MGKKDLLFLITALATSNKFSGRADPQGVREYFMHWHTIYSDIYDELSNFSTDVTKNDIDDVKEVLIKISNEINDVVK